MDTNPLVDLDMRYRPQIERSYNDLSELAGLHGDFVRDCIEIITAKERRASSPLLGKLFPHLVADGLELPSSDRRRLAAAWTALYGYICLVDFKLDRVGSLDARASLGASALLGWAVATLAQITSGSRFSRVLLDNVQLALSGQYEDIENRKDPNYDRRASDVSKNRAIVGTIAGYCAAGRELDDHLIRSTECVLGPFQLLDDLQDLTEDLQEQNITGLGKIIRQVLPSIPDAPDVSLLYSSLVRSPDFLELLRSAETGLGEGILLLDPRRDNTLARYFTYLLQQVSTLVDAVREYQRDSSSISESELYARLHRVQCQYS